LFHLITDDVDASTLQCLFEDDWNYDFEHDQTLELLKVVFKVFPSNDNIDKNWIPNPNYDVNCLQPISNMRGDRLLKAMIKYLEILKASNAANGEFQACGDRVIKWINGLRSKGSQVVVLEEETKHMKVSLDFNAY